jgi:hypothetical protein
MRHVFFGAALVLFLIGVGLQSWVLVAGGWPVFSPLLLALYALPFLVWSFLGLRRPRSEPSRARRGAPLLGVALLVAGPVLYFAFTGNTTRVIRPMTWTTRAAAGESATPEVTLHFVDAPDHFIAMQSPQLADYLARLGRRTVEVEFALSRDFGRVVGFHIVRVQDLTDFRRGQSYSGCARASCEWPW